MGRERFKRRSMVIKKRQKRRFKLARLREKYQKTENESEKDLIWEKVFKLAPWLSREEFLRPLKNKKAPEEEKN